MRQCTHWPAFALPFKLLWLGVGFFLLRHTRLRSFHPALHTTQGLQLVGTPRDSTLNAIVFYRGLFEPVLSRLIETVVQEGDVCVDAGANVGYFTLLLARQVGPSGQVLSVEPVPRNLARLQANVSLNGFADRVKVVQAACGSTSGTATFFVNRFNDMHCRLQLPKRHEWDHWLMGGRSAWDPISVPAVTLAEVLGGRAAEVSFVKLDIEGAEHLVIDDLLRHCSHPRLKVALEAKAPFIRDTLHRFETEGFWVYDLRNTYGWLFHQRVVEPRLVSYAEVYQRRHMVDVLVSRQPLTLPL